MPSERNIQRRHYRVYHRNKPHQVNPIAIITKNPNVFYAVSILLGFKGLLLGYMLGKRR